VTLVVVDRDTLEDFIREMYDLRQAYALEGGAAGINDELDARDELVRLACAGGIPLPGPLMEGHVPPAPPPWLGRLTSPTYREPDGRLRCTGCGKVVYGNQAQAKEAAGRITGARQAMRWYIGECGHYHLSRVKERKT
jgi:hypothetical protein